MPRAKRTALHMRHGTRSYGWHSPQSYSYFERLLKQGLNSSDFPVDFSSQDLESAFRASRRSGAFVAIEKKGKAAFAKARYITICAFRSLLIMIEYTTPLCLGLDTNGSEHSLKSSMKNYRPYHGLFYPGGGNSVHLVLTVPELKNLFLACNLPEQKSTGSA